MKKKRKIFVAVAVFLLLVVGGILLRKIVMTPKFSDEKLFSLRIYEPWDYESLHYTVLCDGTLIVEAKGLELGREQLSEEKMQEIHKMFNPAKVYNMFPGVEGTMTDGISKYIILYDRNNKEIKVGGYMLVGSQIPELFGSLYGLLSDDYTQMWDDRLQDCIKNNKNFREELKKNNWQ